MQNIGHDQQIFRRNPGKGYIFLKVNDMEIAVINLQGRTFMPPLDCPFQKAEELIENAKKRHNDYFCRFSC